MFDLYPMPTGATVAEWVNASHIWPSGNRKWPITVTNTQTKAVTILSQFVPDHTPYAYTQPHSAFSRSEKRVYVSTDEANGTCSYYYIDFTNGVAGATVSSFIRPSGQDASPWRGNSGAFTDGHPTGRKIWYWVDAITWTRLVMQDVANNQLLNLAIPGGEDFRTCLGMGYDPVGNRIIMLRFSQTVADLWECVTITIPSDPTNASGYVTTVTPLALGAGVSTPVPEMFDFHGKSRYIPSLGVVLLPQGTGRMLAFRPA
jgi:hypothetical protein